MAHRWEHDKETHESNTTFEWLIVFAAVFFFLTWIVRGCMA
jgi:hypothetical protein